MSTYRCCGCCCCCCCCWWWWWSEAAIVSGTQYRVLRVTVVRAAQKVANTIRVGVTVALSFAQDPRQRARSIYGGCYGGGVIAAVIGRVISRVLLIAVVRSTQEISFAVGVGVAVAFSFIAEIGQRTTRVPSITPWVCGSREIWL